MVGSYPDCYITEEKGYPLDEEEEMRMKVINENRKNA